MIKYFARIFPANLRSGLPFFAILTPFLLTGCSRAVANNTGFCWGCTIFEALFNAINDITKILYTNIAGSAAGLMAIIFALWIAFRVGKTFFTLKEPDTAEFWADFTKMSFAVMFCGVILLSKETIITFLSFTIIPVFEGVLDFAIAVISKSFADVGVDNNYTLCSIADSGSGPSGDILHESFKQTISCMIYNMHQRLRFGISVASSLLGRGFAEFFFGLALLVVFFLLKLMFPLYMVDGVFHIGIMLILCPILIAFWPFKILRHFASAGWNMFVSAIMHIMIMAIFVTLIVEVLIDFTEMSINAVGTDAIMNGPEAFLFMIFLGFYTLFFMKKTNVLAAQFAGAKAPSSVFAKGAAAMAKIGASVTRAAGIAGAKKMMARTKSAKS